MGFGVLVVMVGLVYLCVDVARGPIIWTWDANSPITVGRSGDDYGVQALVFRGRNHWDEPIRKMIAFVRSDITGEVIPLSFWDVPLIPADEVIIPPDVEFYLTHPFPQSASGMKLADFRRDFASFTFAFAHDEGEPVLHKFNEVQVQTIIARGVAHVDQVYEHAKKRCA